MRLVIAEKPSVAADLARVVDPGGSRRQGWIEGRRFHWTWALGHMAELAPPESYQPALKGRWRLELLPVVPDSFRLQPREGRKDQLNVIRTQLKQAEAVIVATDAGREGELIWEYIREVCGYRGPAERLWLSESTPAAVKAAFAALQAPKSDLAAAARARACADWVIGMNATMALSAHHGGLWSAGRVQTPTLALLVAREAEIRVFQPTDYFVVTAAFAAVETGYKGRWFREKLDRMPTREAAEAVAAKVRGQAGRVLSVRRKRAQEAPPRLFNLNDLQRAGNARHGLTAADTLKAAQALYERHQAITYPRTDSRHVSAEVFKTFPERLRAVGDQALAQDLPHPGKRVVDDAQVSDHHALLPTAQAPDPARLPPDERRVYELIVRRFRAALLPPAIYDDTEAVTEVASETFRSKSRVMVSPGWREAEPQVGAPAEDEEEPEGGNLGALKDGLPVRCTDAEVAARQTKPPKRFTEASLLQVMETAGRLVDDDALAAAMRDRGLGTPATRAQIIETLITREYIVRQGKSLHPTARGERLVSLAPPELREAATTGEWEQRLHAIEAGGESADRFLSDIATVTRRIVADVAGQARVPREPRTSIAEGPSQPAGKTRRAAGPAGGRAPVGTATRPRRRSPAGAVAGGASPGARPTATATATPPATGRTPVGASAGGRPTAMATTKPPAAGRTPVGASPNARPTATATTKPPAAGRTPVGVCPRCGGPVLESPKAFGCANWRPEAGGCRWVLWKSVAGKTLTPTQAGELLSKGETKRVLKGFTSKAGRKFEARLRMERETGRVSFVFPDPTPTPTQPRPAGPASRPGTAAAGSYGAPRTQGGTAPMPARGSSQPGG